MNTESANRLGSSPFIYTRFTSKKANFIIISLLLIQFGVLIAMGDFFAGLNILFAAAGSCAVEYFMQYLNLQKFKFSSEAVITGLLIGFFMPSEIGFIFTFFLSAISIFISKTLFGGTGSNWVNPAALAVCIAYISRPSVFPPVLSQIALLKEKGGMFAVLDSGTLSRVKADFTITSTLNSILLHGVGVTLPEGYISLFLNSSSPIPAFRYNLITLISSIVLFSLRITDYILPFIFIAVYAFLVWIFAQVPVTGIYFSGDILSAILTSGVLFTAFFVLSESSSAPKTKYGKAFSGFLTGVSAFFICGAGSSPSGILFAVLITNIFTPLIEKMEVKIQTLKRKRYE
ncbi:RnfABCDGE type electron transport complex subunit D [Treponema pedis]|uniref:RnfABCDGE type electron transport complex subunit D n=1 Tax=Treponema pedis TaxID=409322 RepID=UPI0004253117|nr:RnfABCDGE type electron transport complex subunit D [Treponema pedis]